MNEKDIKKALDLLNPDGNTKAKIQEKLFDQPYLSSEIKKKPSKKLRVFLIASVIAVGIVCSVLGFNALTGGTLFNSFDKTKTSAEVKEDIVAQAANIPVLQNEVYLPDIYYIDNDILIFGTRRGLIVYDLKSDKVKNTMDLQKIGCFYFDSNSKNTCVLKEKNNVIVFNLDCNIPEDTYYIFNLKTKTQEIQATEVTESKSVTKEYYEKWKKSRENQEDTENIYDALLDFDDNYYMYSENCIEWNKGKYHSFFISGENCVYQLITCSYDEYKVVSRHNLNLENSYDSKLPPFKYTGEDKAVEAICEYMQKEASEWDNYIEGRDVWIPAFLIHGKVQEDGELKVYGDFWNFTFIRNGNILENYNGGEEIACFHLIEDGDGYKVKSVEYAEDGERLIDSIKEMTKWHPIIRFRMTQNMVDHDDELLESLRMYIQNNNLDIKYYKNSGWEPVEIF